MTGKAIMAVTTLIAIGVTLLIYDVAISEWTSSLKLAAGVVCLSELAIMCTLGLFSSVNYKNGATGIMIQVYAIAMIAWALVAPQLWTDKTFHIGLLGISVVMLVAIGLTTFGSHESEKLNQETEDIIDQKRGFANKTRTNEENIPAMWLEMQANIKDKDLLKNVRVLVERIQAMPASMFPNPQIEKSMRELTAMSRALSNPDAKERIIGRMQNKISETTNYIKSL